MIKLKVFLICLAVLLTVFSTIVCVEMYTLEQAIACGFYADILDDMQDIGYLDSQLEDYYREKMKQLHWEGDGGDIFAGTSPRTEAARARKERQETVTLSLRIRPSRVSQWLHLLAEGEAVFRFYGQRPSEYFSPGW